MTSNIYPQNPHILNKDQALIPENYKKSLESRALLQHYQAAQIRKAYDERLASHEKLRDMELSKIQNERHHRQMERKQMMKDNKKYEYSRDYEEMIQMRKQREKYEKQQQLWLEQKLLQEDSWLLNVAQQKQIEKMKKIQYGKQIERHLKMQEERRANEASKIKEQREKMKREAEQSAIRDQMQAELKYKRKNMLEYRQSQNLGVKAALNWSTHEITQDSPDNKKPLTPRMDRMLKVQHQRYYQKGTPAEYKSQSLKKYYQKQNPQSQSVQQIAYNPITNPIPYKYKNPNVLKLLSDYS